MNGSTTLFQKAQQILPGGVNSPVRSFKHVGGKPVVFARGEGAFLYDVDGREYIDFCMSFGPLLLGHAPDVVREAVVDQVKRGTTFGACHPGEVELGELILRAYPFLNRVRLLNSGTEAVMTAVRLARGFTGRNKIVKLEGCYHGHMDGLLVAAGSGVAHLPEAASKGVPPAAIQDTLVGRYDDLSSIEAIFQSHGSEIAALIVEPIPANSGLWLPSHEHISKLQKIVQSHGALLIFDEVITGFRVGLGGAAHFYHLSPDLVTLGKIVGGGLPLAAVVGRKEILDCLAPLGEVYQAGTFSGNALATASGGAVLRYLFEHKGFYSPFERLCEKFYDELKEVLQRRYPVEIVSLGSIFWLAFDAHDAFPAPITARWKESFSELFARALQAGVYLPPSPYEVGFLSFAHDQNVLDEALTRFKRVVV